MCTETNEERVGVETFSYLYMRKPIIVHEKKRLHFSYSTIFQIACEKSKYQLPYCPVNFITSGHNLIATIMKCIH